MSPDLIDGSIGSLRRGLFWRLLPALVAAIAVGGVTSYFVARQSADFAYDQALVAAAADIASGIEVEDGRPTLDLSAQSERILRTDARDDIYFSVYLESGGFLGGDRDLAPLVAIAPNEAVSADRAFRGKVLRAMSLPFVRDGNAVTVTVAETTRKRQAAAWTAFAQMVIPTTGVLLLACLIVWISVRGGLRPLEALQAEIEARSELDLSPIGAVGAPLETRALVSAVNRLLARLDAATRNYQSFVTDAAHQLRTPLAGIQSQVDLLALNATGADEAALDRLRRSVSRATRLTNQLLAMARSDKDATALALQDFDIASLIGEAAETWVHRAIAAHIDLGFDLAPGRLRGDPWLVRELLENLVDNALRLTPEGGQITISTSVEEERMRIAVDDSGPGIPLALRERVFERFFREADGNETGSGLGLAIVRQIVVRHDGRVDARESPLLGGLRVCVELPVAGPGRLPHRAGAGRHGAGLPMPIGTP